MRSCLTRHWGDGGRAGDGAGSHGMENIEKEERGRMGTAVLRGGISHDRIVDEEVHVFFIVQRYEA